MKTRIDELGVIVSHIADFSVDHDVYNHRPRVEEVVVEPQKKIERKDIPQVQEELVEVIFSTIKPQQEKVGAMERKYELQKSQTKEIQRTLCDVQLSMHQRQKKR